MGIKRKPAAIALACGFIAWQLIGQPIWNLNIERIAEKGEFDKALVDSSVVSWLTWFWSYLPGSFGLGFAAGALIFAYWDSIASALPFLKPADPTKSLKPVLVTVHFADLDLRFLDDEGVIYFHIAVSNVGNELASFKEITGTVPVEIVDQNKKLRTAYLGQPFVLESQYIDDLHRWEYKHITIGLPVSKAIKADIELHASIAGGIFLDFSALKLRFSAIDGTFDDVVWLGEGSQLTRSNGIVPSWGRLRSAMISS